MTDATPEQPRPLDPDSFDRFLSTNDLVLVEVWAEWCGPCTQLEPVLEELVAELDDVAVGTVDHDEHPGLTAEYRSLFGRVLTSIPALFVFQEGELVERMLGVQSKADLRATLAPYRDGG